MEGGNYILSVLPASALAYLGSCTQLISLFLSQSGVWEGAALWELTKQLPRLPLLENLHLCENTGAETDCQACLLAAVKLPALQWLELENCG